MLSFTLAHRIASALVGAVLLALAFPSAGLWWCAPIGAAALFWAWEDASWKRAFALGWFAGLLFFSITFWWWSTTIVTVVGAWAYGAVVAGAGLEALAIGAAGVLAVVARRRAPAALAPLAVAAAFAMTEWLRSIGPIGAPFAQLGYSQADTPWRDFAAYVGANGLTFIVCVVAAYLADAVAHRTWRRFGIALGTTAVLAGVAWFAWPARTLRPATIPVAAIQGNITQSLKWQPGALALAVDRYTSMTSIAAISHPALIVWPETVIAINGGGLNENAPLLARFSKLAHDAHATLVAGSIDVHDGGVYNGLFIFTPYGLSATYDKHQLVPFAEHFPGQAFLWWLPYVGDLNGHFAEGTGTGVYATSAGVTIGPLICWESAFGDLAFDEVRHGAQVLVVATDDAWFGTSSGPYQHAQIAQIRAIEAGAYVVRAAATGISGVIAPDGTWRARAALETQAIVDGRVGLPVGSVFARIGPNAVWCMLVALYVLLTLVPWRRRA